MLFQAFTILTLFHFGCLQTLTNRVDPDEMLHNAPFHPDLHCLLREKQSSGTEI